MAPNVSSSLALMASLHCLKCSTGLTILTVSHSKTVSSSSGNMKKTVKIKNARNAMVFFSKSCEADIDGVKLQTRKYLQEALGFYKIDVKTWSDKQLVDCFSHVIREAYEKRKNEVLEILKAKRRNKDKKLILDALMVKPLVYDFSKYQLKNGSKPITTKKPHGKRY